MFVLVMLLSNKETIFVDLFKIAGSQWWTETALLDMRICSTNRNSIATSPSIHSKEKSVINMHVNPLLSMVINSQAIRTQCSWSWSKFINPSQLKQYGSWLSEMDFAIISVSYCTICQSALYHMVLLCGILCSVIHNKWHLFSRHRSWATAPPTQRLLQLLVQVALSWSHCFP